MILPGARQVTPRRAGVPYRCPAGTPWRWVIHTDEVPDAPMADIAATLEYPPHFFYDPATDELLQLIDTNLAAYALEHRSGDPETNHQHAIQVELHARAANTHEWPATWLDRLRARLLAPVAAHHHIDLARHPTTVLTPARRLWMTWAEWATFPGIAGHGHTPGQYDGHWDPGPFNFAYIANHQEDDDMPTLNEIEDLLDAKLAPIRSRLDAIDTTADAGLAELRGTAKPHHRALYYMARRGFMALGVAPAILDRD